MENQDELLQYIQLLNVNEQEQMYQQLIAYAKENHVPIMEDIGIDFLCQLARIKKPKIMIEIGTAIGYSAIRLAHTCPEAQIYTFERNETRIQEARKNIKQFGLTEQIHVIEGDALETFEQLPKNLGADFLFIDAAKGKSRQFLESYTPYLNNDPLIIIDNVLFKGYVISDEGLTRRKKQLIRKIKDFHQWITNHPDYATVILPVGDGIALCTKKQRSM